MTYDSQWIDVRNDVRAALTRRLEETGIPDDVVSRLSCRGRLNRASLFLMLADPCDGGAQRHVVVGLAVGLEMIHKASVIRDDVEDEDVLRRGFPTEFAIMGRTGALTLSDVLLSGGLATIFHLAPEAMSQVLETLVTMSLGQFYDVHRGVRMRDPFEIAERKTGSLLALVFWMGAFCSRRSPEDLQLLHHIGLHLGTAFQLANDINNVTRDEGRGKNPRSDLLEHRNSSIALLLNQQIEAGGGTAEVALSVALKQVRLEVARRLREAKELASRLTDPLPDRIRLLVNSEKNAHEFVSDQQWP
ncbi:polyprenyl synthetase family protein [Streptomyces pseudovenezuelae]|uniref:polyprenyl synthetase family protein n=1 Tax=Streptomyces pseudovenezuelae TaxID=67350 RepID=UPI0034A24477